MKNAFLLSDASLPLVGVTVSVVVPEEQSSGRKGGKRRTERLSRKPAPRPSFLVRKQELSMKVELGFNPLDWFE
jgi:hypothetical protein